MKRKEKVLVADDSADIIEVIRIMLQDEYEVIAAMSGRDAVDLFRLHKPQLVLIDINMPEMDGVKAMKEIMRIDPNAKVIVVSAYARDREKELLDLGAKEVVEKPFSKKVLVEAIRRCLDEGQTAQS